MRSLIWWAEVPGASDRGVMPALGRTVARARGPIIAEAPGAPGRATHRGFGSEAPGRDARIEERSVGSGGARRPRLDARRCALRARGRDHRVSRLPPARRVAGGGRGEPAGAVPRRDVLGATRAWLG